MLHKVIIYMKEQIHAINDLEFWKECEEKGIQIAIIDINEVDKCNKEEDVLWITDVKIELSDDIPVVGVGYDYQGSCGYLVEELESIDLNYLEMVYARAKHQPLVIAENKELLIREMTLDDLDAMYALYDTLEGCEFIEPLYERGEEERFTKDYINNMYTFFGYGLWLVFEKKGGNLIGRAGIENRVLDGETVQELGYLIGKPWQRRHYAQQAADLILKYAFDYLGIEHLFLCTEQKNIPSIALAEKLGFSIYAENVDGMNVYIKDQMHIG